MNNKNILIINGHPDAESFNVGLVNAYRKGAKSSNAKVSVINIAELNFDLSLQFGYRKRTELEHDLIESIDKIKKANHIVWIFPQWWYGYPAIMKGFIDRTFLPGITFDYEEGKTFPNPLLKGKSARIVVTADTPRWYNNLFMKKPAVNQLKRRTLPFCGITPVKVTYISPIKDSTQEFREKWIRKIEVLGKQNK